jgi:hypothetical protein
MDQAWIGVVGAAVGGGVALVSGFVLSARDARREHRALRREAYYEFLFALDDARDLSLGGPGRARTPEELEARETLRRQLKRAQTRLKLLAPEVISDAAYDASSEAWDLDRGYSNSAYIHFSMLARSDVKPSITMGPRVFLTYIIGSQMRRQDVKTARKRAVDSSGPSVPVDSPNQQHDEADDA